MPLLPVVLHPGVCAGHRPRLQLHKVVLACRLPVLLSRLVVAPGLIPGRKGQAGTRRSLPAIELSDQLADFGSVVVKAPRYRGRRLFVVTQLLQESGVSGGLLRVLADDEVGRVMMHHGRGTRFWEVRGKGLL